MDSFLQMDIFFFITSAVALVLGALAAYILWQIARILRHVEHISEQASRESDLIRADMAEVRRDINEGKGKVKSLFGLLTRSVKRHLK